MSNSKIKLCGMRRIEDIEAVNELKPEYVGFIFWPKSFRCLKKEEAAILKNHLSKDIIAVGVFVDEDINIVADLANCKIIDYIQLHGNESEEYIDLLRTLVSSEVKIIKAFKADSKESIDIAVKSNADYILFDPGKGEGMTFGWDILENVTRPYFLAGGLNSDNVKDAIKKLSPYGVDVSSGIETDKYKDVEKMQKFVLNVRDN